jgi:hypothetical protein
MPAPHLRLALAGLVALLAAAPAANAETRSLKLLSDGPFRTDPASPAGFLYESADGSRAFFQTDEPLEGTDTDATLDAYMRTSAGALVHVTDNPFAADGQIDAYLEAVSRDGTRAFFSSQEQLANTDNDGTGFDAWERTPAGALVHHSDGGATDLADAEAYFVAITPDGKHAYFESYEKLAATDTDNGGDIYERGPAGPIHLSDGPKTDGDDYGADFQRASDDGTRVYFTTTEKLVDSDTDDSGDVYQHTAAGPLHISDDPTGAGADAEEEADFIDESADGARVWFNTRESLAAADTDAKLDVYERAPSGALTLITDDGTDPDAEVDAFYRGRSTDGRRIVFETTESLAPTDTDTEWDVYERLPDGKLLHVSDNPTGPDANVSATYNGMSSDGTRVLFATTEKLVATDTDTTADVYERLPNGTLLHVTDDPLGPDDAIEAGATATSSDASRIFFTTRERLAPTDTDTSWDTYERWPGGLRHVTDNPVGPDAEVDPYLQHVSPDGRRVYFTTDEPLARADTDAVGDVYLSTAVPTPATPRPADRLAPTVTRFKVTRRGRVRFTLSEPADVRLVVRRRGSRPRTRLLADRPAGANAARVLMRARGRYRVTITATDAAGNRSAPRRIRVRVRGPE